MIYLTFLLFTLKKRLSSHYNIELYRTVSVSIILSIQINRSQDLRRTSSCSSLLKKSQNQSSESVFHKCFPLNLVYGKAKKNSVPIVVFQPVPEGVEHISHLIDSKCAFCNENCRKF